MCVCVRRLLGRSWLHVPPRSVTASGAFTRFSTATTGLLVVPCGGRTSFRSLGTDPLTSIYRCLRQQKRKLQGLTGQTLHPIFHVAFCFVFLVVWGSETFRLRKWRRQVAVAAVFGRAVAELPLLGESHSAKARRGPAASKNRGPWSCHGVCQPKTRNGEVSSPADP